jgi:hypothetical protein
MLVTLLLIFLIAILLIGLVGGGLLVLVKLGVITSYAFKEEPEDSGVYGIDQSQEAGD